MPQIFKKLFIGLFSIGSLLACSKNEIDHPKKNLEITTFVNIFGGSKNDSGQSVIKTLDGGFAILGFTQSMDGDVQNKSQESFDYWLLKFANNSQLEWQKTYGGSKDDVGQSLLQLSDGSYVIFGSSTSMDGDVTTNAGNSDLWLVKLDPNGNIVWEQSYGYSGLDSGTKIVSTNDNGLLLIGVLDVTSSAGEGNSKTTSAKRHAGGDYWIIKLDASGTKEWSHYYGGSFNDTPHDAIQTTDNGYLIVGSSDSDDVDIASNIGTYDFWVLKISETGTLEWEQSYGGTEIDEAWAIEEAGDGNYLVVGDTRSTDEQISQNKGAADIWIIKITPSGNLLWEKTLGGLSFDAGRNITGTKDGKFVICGNSRSAEGDLTENKGQNDVWVVKIDSNAAIEWQKTVGGSQIDLAFDCIENNGNIFVVGETNSSDGDIPKNNGFTDLLLISLTENE